MTAPTLPFRREGDALLLTLRVTPKGGRDAIDGVRPLDDGRSALHLRVRVAPDDGAANEAVIALLATSLACPKSRLSLISGATQRLKVFRLVDEERRIEGALAALCG